MCIRDRGCAEERLFVRELVPGGTVEPGRLYLDPAPELGLLVLEAGSRRPLGDAGVYLERRVPGPQWTWFHADRTDRAGRAAVNAFPGYESLLAVVAPGYAPRVGPAPLPGVDRGDRREIELSPGGEVHVAVVDSGGLPVPGIPVRRLPGPGYGMECLEGGDGAARERLTDGTGVTRFQHLADHPQLFGPAIQRHLPGTTVFSAVPWEGTVEELVIGVPGLARCTGSVKLDGEELVGAVVRVGEHPWSPWARTNARGRFELRPLWRGRHELTVRHPSLALPASLEVRLEGESWELPWDVRTGALHGQVEAPHGQGVEGAEVRVLPAGAGRGVRFKKDLPDNVWRLDELRPPAPVARADADGFFAVDRVPTGVEARLAVSLEGAGEWWSKALESSSRRPRSFPEVELVPGGRLRRARDPRGETDLGYAGILAVYGDKQPALRTLVYLSVEEWHDEGARDLRPGRWTLYGCTPDEFGAVEEYERLERVKLEPGELRLF